MKETSYLYSLEGQESERLLFRKLEDADFNTWLKFCEDPDSLAYIFDEKDLHLDAIAKCKLWFERSYSRYNQKLGGMNVLVEKLTGALVGQCGLLVQTVDEVQELEIGYSLMPEYRHKGFASEAAKKCRDFAFENNFAQSLISIIHIHNHASAKVALNNGMKLDKQTLFHDAPVNIYRVVKSQL